MGMPVSVIVRDGVGEGAVDGVFGWLRWVDATFSTWRRDSEISRLNAGELSPRDLHPLTREVLGRCERMREVTGGAFDARAAGARGVDPTGLVKGWAVDRAAALLEAAGARDYCLDAGGDVRVGGGPWRVGIRHPRRRRRLAAVVGIADAAVATSGAYERGAHIVDPRSGRPPAGVESVTVVGPDLASADAYATAAFALGEEGPAWTAGLSGYEAMTILAGGRVLSTPGFAKHCAGDSPASSIRR
jgi:thiamine biosynthesis lipoprotein